MRVCKKLLLNALILTAYVGCSNFSSGERKILVKQNVTVTIENEQPKNVKANESIKLQDKPILIENPGHIAVMLVPVNTKETDVEVKLKKLDAANFNTSMVQIYNRDLTYISGEVYQIQKLIQQKKNQLALTKLETLKQKYPKLTYLVFLEASIYYVLGDKQKSKQLLEVGLAQYPQDQNAQSLYGKLLKKGEVNKFRSE